jgi:hypothetical protein
LARADLIDSPAEGQKFERRQGTFHDFSFRSDLSGCQPN